MPRFDAFGYGNVEFSSPKRAWRQSGSLLYRAGTTDMGFAERPVREEVPVRRYFIRDAALVQRRQEMSDSSAGALGLGPVFEPSG